MVWPFTPNSNAPPNSSAQQQDPLQNLDPSLRSFLERESPLKYNSPTATSQQQSSSSLSAPLSGTATNGSPTDTTSQPQSSRGPPTLFKDGRYAHLWATYKPLADVEASASSPQEKLTDVLSAYRDRKASIAQAALENCAEEQWDLNECYRTGKWTDRMLSCTSYVRKLDRCYTVNQRLLRALGYLSAWDRPPEVEERIQMHADKLFHNMLEQERWEAEARERGDDLPAPASSGGLTATGLLGADAMSKNARDDKAKSAAIVRGQADMGLPAIVEELRPRIRERFAEKLNKMKPEERALEERALAMEMIAGKDVARQVTDLQQQRMDEKTQRKIEGKETISDKVSSLLGW